MAISLGTTSTSTDQSSSPATWNHTVNNGLDTFLIVSVGCSATVSQPTCTAVTYGGTSMKEVKRLQFAGDSNLKELTMWFLYNPTTGTNQVSATVSGGTSPHYFGSSTSYFGVRQANTADATGSATSTTANADITFIVTTGADNCWVYAAGLLTGLYGGLTADQTLRGSLASPVFKTEDTNGPVTPAGNQTMGFTVVSNAGFLTIGASFAPAVPYNPFNYYKKQGYE